MKITASTAVLAFVLTVAAAPIDNGKRQLTSSSGDALPSLPVSGFTLPTGLSGGSLGGSSGSSGLGGSSSSGGLGGLSGLGGSTGSTGGLEGLSGSTGGLSGLSGSTGGLSGLSGGSSGLSSLSGLSSGGGSSLTPTTTLKKRQSLGSGTGIGSLTTGSSSSGLGGLSGLGGSSSGTSFGSFPSLGSSSGSGIGSFGGLSGGSGSSSLGGVSGLTGTGTSTSTGTGTAVPSAADEGTSTGTSSGGCKALTLIFARGTGEMGTMGSVIGPPLASALESSLGADKVASEGVDYPADSAGNANMGATGGKAMASQASAVLSSCPDTKLVLSGYSQGAMVVHNALSAQGLDGSKVAAIVAFGDPLNGQAFEGVDASKVKEFCGSSDFLCSAGGTTGSGSHISYTGDAQAAADFIVQAVGL